MQKAVSQFMTPMPKTIGHDISTDKAQAMMQELRCHHLPVLDGGKLVGIISERDLKMLEGIASLGPVPVEELMMDEPVVVEPLASIKDVIDIMLKEQIGSVIVQASDKTPWGIFTSTDALKLLQELM